MSNPDAASEVGSIDGVHWTGPIGDEPPMSGHEDLHAETLAAYADLLHFAVHGNMAAVREFMQSLNQPMVEQMLLSIIAETAVQAVAAGLHP